MQLEILTTHFSLIQLALASSLKLPLLGKGPHTNTRINTLSYVLFVFASLFLSISFYIKFNSAPSVDLSIKELALILFASWVGVLTLPFLKSSSYQILLAPLLLVLLSTHLFRDWSRMYPHEDLQSIFLNCHISCAIAGEILAVLASLIAIAYLGQHQVLKEKRFVNVMKSLPALDLLDDMLLASLGAGFIFLSIALGSGAVFLYQEPVLNNNLLLKLIWAFAVWFCYLSALILRVFFHFSTKTLAKISLIGFSLLALAYFGLVF